MVGLRVRLPGKGRYEDLHTLTPEQGSTVDPRCLVAFAQITCRIRLPRV